MDTLIINANLATMTDNKLGIIKQGALGIKDGKINWLGRTNELTSKKKLLANTIIDAQQHWLTPGLIDCHTHLVYGGSRIDEFVQRCQGASYEQLAKAGGGILSTVKQTRAASAEELLSGAQTRLNDFISHGVTTLEIKSGYGLDLDSEKKMLMVAQQLADINFLDIKKTFLGAHVLPLEYKNKPKKYIDFLTNTLLPELVDLNLVDHVDAFCDTLAFTAENLDPLFNKAQELSLPIKCHLDQLSLTQGAQLAAKYNAQSVEHLEYLDLAGVQALAQAKTTAVLLPGAYYYLQATQKPPINLLREYNIPIAIATDCNPGSSPTTSLLGMMNLGCRLFGLTIDEVWLGVTRQAAKALGCLSGKGTLEIGKNADLVLWHVQELQQIPYQLGFNPKKQVFKNGELVKNYF